MGKAAKRWDAFVDITRKPGQSLKQYVGHYEEICKYYTESIGSLSNFAKALHLLRTAKLSDKQYEMILAMCEGEDTELIYGKIKKAVICQLPDKLNDIKGSVKMPAEQAFLAESDEEDEDVMAASFHKKQAWRKKQQFQQQQKQPTGQKQQSYSSNSQRGTHKPQDRSSKNQSDNDDRCFFCRSNTNQILDCNQGKKMRNQYQDRRRNKTAYLNIAENHKDDQNADNYDDSEEETGQPGNVLLSYNLATPKHPEITDLEKKLKTVHH